MTNTTASQDRLIDEAGQTLYGLIEIIEDLDAQLTEAIKERDRALDALHEAEREIAALKERAT